MEGGPNAAVQSHLALDKLAGATQGQVPATGTRNGAETVAM